MELFLIIGLGLLFFLGQGWLLVGPLLHGSFTTPKSKTPLLQQIPLMLMCGLILNYGTVLLLQSLKFSLFTGCAASIFGVFCFAIYLFQHYKQQIPFKLPMAEWAGIFILSLLFLVPILTIPLEKWDARSIWFFHAKMIYTAGSIGQSAGWQHPSVIFSHTDYPNLVPALAAQAAYVMGFWNEYLPKISLFFMLIPAIIWLFTFARRSFSFGFLLLMPFIFYMQMWGGEMDGFLALYFSLAMLLLGRYINSSQRIDLISSICCLIFIMYIKNEGMLAALIGLCLIALHFLFTKGIFLVKNLSGEWKYLAAGLIVLMPLMLWNFYKHQWGLSNDLELGTTQSFLRIATRPGDGSLKLISRKMYPQIEGFLLLLGLLYFSYIARGKPLPKESMPALAAAGIYYAGILIIYLSTPYDLVWHLNTSVSRTMLLVIACIYIAVYYLLDNLKATEKTAHT